MVSALDRVAAVLAFPAASAVPWSAFRYRHLVALRALLMDTKMAPATINKYLSAVRGVLRELWRSGDLGVDDYHRILDVKGVAGSRLPAGRALVSDELAALFAAADDGTCAGSRDRALFTLLYAGGLRRAEAVSLRLSALDTTLWVLRVLGKGDVERLVPFAAIFRDVLGAWLAVRGPIPGPLISLVATGDIVVADLGLSAPTVRRRLAVRAEQAGIAACSPHDLRRTFVTALLDAGVDFNVVRKLAGHRQLQTTARYDRRDDTAAAEAVVVLDSPLRSPGPEPDSSPVLVPGALAGAS